MRVSEKVIRTIDQRLLFNILAEQEKQTKLLERIADTLDVMAIAQDAQTKLLDERTEPPVTVRGEYPLPGFDGDPLDKFPSVRKDDENGTAKS